MDNHNEWTAAGVLAIGYVSGVLTVALHESYLTWMAIPWTVACGALAAAWWNWRKRD